MPSRPPFADPATGTLDTAQLLSEAVPLAKLIATFVAVALVPFALSFLVGFGGSLGALLTVLGQFVLAVGSGIVLIYCIARGIQLAGE